MHRPVWVPIWKQESLRQETNIEMVFEARYPLIYQKINESTLNQWTSGGRPCVMVSHWILTIRLLKQVVPNFCIAFQKMSVVWQLVIIKRPLDTQTDSSTSEAIAILELFTMPLLTVNTMMTVDKWFSKERTINGYCHIQNASRTINIK